MPTSMSCKTAVIRSSSMIFTLLHLFIGYSKNVSIALSSAYLLHTVKILHHLENIDLIILILTLSI